MYSKANAVGAAPAACKGRFGKLCGELEGKLDSIVYVSVRKNTETDIEITIEVKDLVRNRDRHSRSLNLRISTSVIYSTCRYETGSQSRIIILSVLKITPYLISFTCPIEARRAL